MRFDLADLSLFRHVVEAGSITHGAERAHLALDWSRADIASLGSLANAPQFRASMLNLKPGGITGKQATPSISDEFAMVFDGRVILKLQDSEQTLERGDSVTMVAGTGRQWRNETDSMAEILVVSVGPYS